MLSRARYILLIATTAVIACVSTQAIAPSDAGQDVAMDGGITKLDAADEVTPIADAEAPSCATAGGVLDPGFGTGGMLALAFGSQAVALAKDTTTNGYVVVTSQGEWSVVKVTSSGALDASFGTGGLTSVHPAKSWPTGVAVQTDGKIVVVGTYMPTFPAGFALARYMPDGTLDSSFGNAGFVITPFGGDDQGWAVGVQPDGKIVAAGVTFPSPQNPSPVNLAVARYLPNGTLDAAFGTQGKVKTLVDGKSVSTTQTSVRFRNGRILVGGGTAIGQVENLYAVALLSDGSIDSTFGTNGVATNAAASNSVGTGMTIDRQGRVVQAAIKNIGDTTGDFAVVRYAPTGSIDTTFGAGGVATYDYGADERATGLVTLDDGSVVLAGMTRTHFDGGVTSDFMLARFTVQGGLDPSFGIGGTVRTTLAPAFPYAGLSAIIVDGCSVVVAGMASGNAGDRGIVSRYLL